MKFDSYHMQVLVLVAENCKPNSPYPERAWWRPTPVYGCETFGNALSILIRDGLLKRKHGYRVKPSPAGYALIGQWRAYRNELRRRPVLYDRYMWDKPIAVGQQT